MTSKERMRVLASGQKADRAPFLPTIFEHSASMLGLTPSIVCRDSDLIAETQIKAYRLYQPDAVTIGIDVYNIEAEALGCKIRFHDDNSIPGVVSHPFEDGNMDFTYSDRRGRIRIIQDAAVKVIKEIGDIVNVNIGICGPFSIAVELAGYEDMLMMCLYEEEKAHELLKNTLLFQKDYCNDIISHGAGVTLFESWATPPIVSPDIYREFIKPYEFELITHIKSAGLPAPLVIGGDTSAIADDIIETGTTLLVADYNVDISDYLKKAEKNNLMLRGNIDPKLVQSGPVSAILERLDLLMNTAGGYNKFVVGTGVIPYDTPQDNIHIIRKTIEKYKI